MRKSVCWRYERKGTGAGVVLVDLHVANRPGQILLHVDGFLNSRHLSVRKLWNWQEKAGKSTFKYSCPKKEETQGIPFPPLPRWW